MRILSEEGMTITCVTHEMESTRDLSARFAYIYGGLIEDIGPPKQVFKIPISERTSHFLANVQ